MYFYEILFPVQKVHNILLLKSRDAFHGNPHFSFASGIVCFVEINIVLVTEILLIVILN